MGSHGGSRAGGGTSGSSQRAADKEFDRLMSNERSEIKESDRASYKLMLAAQEEAPKMAALNGSEKQVSWAEDIRTNAFGQLNSEASRTIVAGRQLNSNDIAMFKPLTDDRRAVLEEIPKFRKGLTNILANETNASKIIDMRDSLDGNSISNAVNKIAQARSQAKAQASTNARAKSTLDILNNDYDNVLKRMLNIK